MSDTLTVTDAQPTTVAERILIFDRPLIGFPGTRRYMLRSLGDAYAPFATLSSLDEEGLGFIVVAPGALYRDYVVEIPEPEAAALGLTGSGDVEIFTLVTRHGGAAPTVNLMGPIVVNRRSDRASQVVLQDALYGVAVAVDAPSARSAADA
ncbi:MAG: FliW protein [Acidimicrobiaceae bacterium]|nr:FliW protein [Acidimicrobiaceae bacterium]